MEKGFVYVLKCKDQKLYVGATRNLEERLNAHEMGCVRTTKIRRPVQLIYKEEYEGYSEAYKRELYFKSGTGRDWLKENWRGG